MMLWSSSASVGREMTDRGPVRHGGFQWRNRPVIGTNSSFWRRRFTRARGRSAAWASRSMAATRTGADRRSAGAGGAAALIHEIRVRLIEVKARMRCRRIPTASLRCAKTSRLSAAGRPRRRSDGCLHRRSNAMLTFGRGSHFCFGAHLFRGPDRLSVRFDA